jgi:hypothetical protein
MAKAELKTKATEVSAADFIAAQSDERRRNEAAVIDAIYRRVTGMEPTMWGPSIIGYGSYTYKYESGREGAMCRAGFSPRKAAMTLYGIGGAAETAEGAALLARLGKHTTGKGCLYVKKLADVDLEVLEALIAAGWAAMNRKFPE